MSPNRQPYVVDLSGCGGGTNFRGDLCDRVYWGVHEKNITVKRGYFVGIGSNINSKVNIANIIGELCPIFPEIYISEVAITIPVNIETTNSFLNAVLFVSTECEEDDLKKCFVGIEEKLGRRKDLLDRKLKDRTADIDVLSPLITLASETIRNFIPDEPYFRNLYLSLVKYLGFTSVPEFEIGETVEVQSGGKSFGKSPATINGNS